MKGSLCYRIVNENTSPGQLNKKNAGKEGRHKASARRKKRGSRLVNAVLILIFLAGIALLAYPTFSDWWNDLHQSRAIAGYVEKVSDMSDKKNRAMWEAAQAYNQRLLAKSGDRFVLTDEEKEAYNKILDVTGTGIMGYVNIPKIAVSLPIYHGTDPAVLEIAVGHIEGSSMPVGGRGTHCVISGHRGLPSAKLFTDID